MQRLTRELREDVLEIRVERVVRRHQHGKPILVDTPERLGRVDAALVEDRVDAIACEVATRCHECSAGARHGGHRATSGSLPSVCPSAGTGRYGWRRAC